jgi:LPXTG-motif cell wall-anchored protein
MKIFLILVFAGLLLAPPAHAILIAPQGDNPLQPIPQGTGVNHSNNINSANSPYNKQLEQEQNQVQEAEPAQNNSQSPEAVTSPETAVQESLPSAGSVWQYWILLIIGILGLIGGGIWFYLRWKKIT